MTPRHLPELLSLASHISTKNSTQWEVVDLPGFHPIRGECYILVAEPKGHALAADHKNGCNPFLGNIENFKVKIVTIDLFEYYISLPWWLMACHTHMEDLFFLRGNRRAVAWRILKTNYAWSGRVRDSSIEQCDSILDDFMESDDFKSYTHLRFFLGSSPTPQKKPKQRPPIDVKSLLSHLVD